MSGHASFLHSEGMAPGVGIHTDVRAGAVARALGAQARAAGRHVYFAPGRYAPDRSAAEIREVADQIEAMLGAQGEAPGGAWSDYAALEPVRAHASRHECVMLPLRALLAALEAGGSTDRGS